jgi:hypothetical protein
MGGAELFLGGIAALAILSMVVKARVRVRTARATAEIARAGASPVSLVGRVLTTALVIGGTQWLVLTYSDNVVLWWVVLGLPALVTAYTVTKALTVMQVNPSRSRRGGWQ